MRDPEEKMPEALEEAVVALREQTDAPASELEAARTRARILASHRASARRAAPMTWLAAAAALVIVLGGSTAWAYWTGRLDAWVRPRAPEHAAPAPVIAPPHVREPEVETPPVVAPSAPPEVVQAAAPETTIAEATAETTERTPVDPRERAAYRAAHVLHFDDHDPARAITAWDAYLAAYPSGRFALEARYNRALCLVRLGRTSEARAALAPFVEGTHGGYRQQEATALANALDAE